MAAGSGPPEVVGELPKRVRVRDARQHGETANESCISPLDKRFRRLRLTNAHLLIDQKSIEPANPRKTGGSC